MKFIVDRSLDLMERTDTWNWLYHHHVCIGPPVRSLPYEKTPCKFKRLVVLLGWNGEYARLSQNMVRVGFN